MKLIERLMLYKFAFNRAVGHVNTIRAVVEPTMLAGILLKLYGVTSIVLIISIGIVLTIMLFVIGFIDIKLGVASTEASIGNRYNPELSKILENTQGGKHGKGRKES